MNTTHTRKLFVTSAVGAAMASVATTALLFLGAGTAQAAGIIDNLPTPRTCGSCMGFNPQPDPPSFPDRSTNAGIGNPNDRPQITNPGNSIGLGGPDTLPPQHN